MAKNDNLEPFKNANIEMYFDDSSKKWNAELKLRNEETIEFSFNASENDLSDFWYGFNYNGKEYDMNICNGGDYGNGGWIYPVDNEGHVDTSISEQLDSVNIYSRNRNNIQFWIWKDYDDLSGHLVAPDGKSYFSYDWTTKEYKVKPDSGWDSFLDADPTRDTSLTAFKEYAQKFVKENIVRDSDIKIIFEREYIDTEKLLKEEKRMAKSETLADKYNRMEKLFEGKMSHLGSGNGETFKELCKWVEEEFPEKDSEGVLLEATSRMIEENLDFGEFNYQAFDDVYGFGDGAEWRLDFSDSAAKELLSGEIVTLSDAQSLIWEKAEKEFAALKENPLYKDEIEITDRINSAFRIADFLYPEFTKEIDKEKNLLPDEWPQYSNEEKKTVINNAFEKIKSAFDEKKVRLSDSRTDELVFEGSDKRLLLGDFKALIKGKDAAEHGKESLSYSEEGSQQRKDYEYINSLYKKTFENYVHAENISFIDDEEKMRDFAKISKEEFLSSYSYLSEEEYNATSKDYNKLKQKAVHGRFSDSIKTIDDVNNIYEKLLDFIEQNVSFKESNPEYNEIDDIEKWKNGELYIPVADGNGNFTNDMEANTLADYNVYAGKNFESYSDLIEYQAGLKAKVLDNAIENSITEYLRREYAETSPNSGKFELTVENQSYPIDKDGLNFIINNKDYGSVEDRLNEIIDKRFEEEIEQKGNDLVSDVLEYIAQETNGNLVLKDNEISNVLFSDELVQIYAPKVEFLTNLPENTKFELIAAGIAKEELYNNEETITLPVSEEARNIMLSASYAGQGGLTQKAFADNGIEIDIETANALENCFSQIEAITKYTSDGHDLFSKGNGIDTISEHSIEYSEETKSWFIHEKNWLAVSAIKGDEAGPDDYMEKADRVGDRNWSIGCELLVKYVYQEIKEDGEIEKEFPDIFKKLENLKDYTETLTEAKQLISDFCFDEYMSTPIFDDLKDVGLAYTTFDDPYTHEEHEIQTSADLVNCKIITKVNNKVADVTEFENLKDMVVNSLNTLDFDSLVYLPTSIKDEVLKEEREEIEKHLLEKADQIIEEAFEGPSFAKRAKLYIPSDYGYDYDNKIHILVEFDNEAEREDELFNALAEKHFTFPDGTEVDFNPIKPEKSGTIEQYLESLNRIKENRYQRRREDALENVIVSKDNFREVFNEISKLPKFKDKPLEAAGWCFARVPKDNREEVGKWLATLNGSKKKNVNNLFDKWNKENNPKPITNKSKTNEKDDWSISD